MNTVAKFALLNGCLMLAGATHAVAEGYGPESIRHAPHRSWPWTNAIRSLQCRARPGFCKNVTLGASTKLSDLFAKAAAGTPDPGWDFEPDIVKIKEGTDLSVVDQGGEPHTFTEVAHFGGGFIPGLNAPGEVTVPECAGGFSNVAVARTRILQASTSQVTGLSKGQQFFSAASILDARESRGEVS